MGTFSIWHWVIVLAVILLLFGGGGKIPRIMGDLAKGIRSFKSGLKDDEGDDGKSHPKTIDAKAEHVEDAPAAKRESETVNS